jgi:proline-specific peptidase
MRLLLFIVFLVSSVSTHSHQDPEIAGFVDVDGGSVWYRLNGREHLGSKPAIIVLHGGPGVTHRGNMPYVQLADSYPVILYDQLGSGNSDRPTATSNWTTERFVDEIGHIKRQLKLDKIIVAGHSWGGTVTAEFALRQTNGLQAIILSSPLISTAQWVKDNNNWRKDLPEEVQATLLKHERENTTNHPDYLAAAQVFYKSHMCRKQPCPHANYKDGDKGWNPALYEYMWGSSDFFATGTLKNYSIEDKLSEIAVPTLMICGEFDEAAPTTCRKYADDIENSSVVIIPDAGHSTMRENEAMYVEEVRKFLDSL